MTGVIARTFSQALGGTWPSGRMFSVHELDVKAPYAHVEGKTYAKTRWDCSTATQTEGGAHTSLSSKAKSKGGKAW